MSFIWHQILSNGRFYGCFPASFCKGVSTNCKVMRPIIYHALIQAEQPELDLLTWQMVLCLTYVI